RFLSEIFLQREQWDGSDIAITENLFGQGRNLLRPTRLIVISQRLYRLLDENNVKVFSCEIVRLVCGSVSSGHSPPLLPTALKNLGIKGPYVLVGRSLGGLVARVYAGRYPDEVAGMVFVDHAGSPTLLSLGNKPLPPPPPLPSAPSGRAKLPTGAIERPNFSK